MVLSHSKKFWLIFACLSVLAACVSYKYLDKVYSLVNLKISVDRHEVLAQAKTIAQELSWNISDYQQVTTFDSQDDVQSFIELEAGGKEAFVTMFQSGLYYPYHWHVRFFKPQNVEEMHVWFSPEGKKLGFFKKVSELFDGPALSKEKAQELIESKISDWCYAFKAYKLIEYDGQNLDNGRVDHTFTYERADVAIGKGLYRFKATISGDTITKMEPLLKIPDNFTRRYQEMRSANILLCSLGMFLFRLLYLLFFALVGLIIFYRRNYLLGSLSGKAAVIVSGAALLEELNDYPLWWSSYQTVQSPLAFIVMKLFQVLIGSLSLCMMIWLSCIVAEAAGRFVYKKHIQFFKIFTPSVAGTYAIAEQVVFGYLMVPFMMLYVVIFGYIMKQYCGWWSPAGSLSDPNVIASFLPWLSTITRSLRAGFFEEVLFRALPLAMTAFLTKDSKYKKFWFIFIFILQALIFGACHANYPNQPFYARLIELILPSFGFAWIYLAFGLLPGVITHCVYDVIWFSMPVFASNLLLSKLIIIIGAGLPLWIVIGLYLYNKKFTVFSGSFLNQSFSQAADYIPTIKARVVGNKMAESHRIGILVLGLVGCIAWGMTHKFSLDIPSISITKEESIRIALQTIEHQFQANIDDTWTVIATAHEDVHTTESRFIWQVYGKDVYNLASGSYLKGLCWRVRCIKFSGAVEDRTEEYSVTVSTAHDGHVLKAVHRIPEHQAGKDLSQEQAQEIFYNFIEKNYCLTQDDTAMISVISDKFDNRRDWIFTIQDTQVFDFASKGQARITVKISGDQVSEYYRFIFVPEDWSRADKAKVMNIGIITMGLWFILIFAIIFGFIFGIASLMTSRFGVVMMQQTAWVLGIISIVCTINSVPLSIAEFITAEPFYDQCIRLSLGLSTMLVFQLLFCSLFLAMGAVGLVRGKNNNLLMSCLMALSGASMILGAQGIVSWLEPSLEPVIRNYLAVSQWSPAIGVSFGATKMVCFLLSLMMMLSFVMEKIDIIWPGLPSVSYLFILLLSIGLESLQSITTIEWMFVHALVMSIVLYLIYYELLIYDMTILPLLSAALVMMMIVPEFVYPSYPGASLHAVIACLMVICIALFFYQQSHKE